MQYGPSRESYSYRGKNRGVKRREQFEWPVSNYSKKPKKVKNPPPYESQNKPRKNVDYVLQENVEPSLQLLGRLELGLGNILKEIRSQTNLPFHSQIFQTSETVKALKTELRDRIRSVMLGKHVAGLTAVVDAYRLAYPMQSDAELMTLVKEKLNKEEMIKNTGRVCVPIHFSFHYEVNRGIFNTY